MLANQGLEFKLNLAGSIKIITKTYLLDKQKKFMRVRKVRIKTLAQTGFFPGFARRRESFVTMCRKIMGVSALERLGLGASNDVPGIYF